MHIRLNRKALSHWTGIGKIGLLLALGLVLTIPGPAQAPSAPAPVEAKSGTPPQAAYHLPPAKLAQAIALNRVRLILHFASEFWELTVFWLLLATGFARWLAGWIESKTSKGWLQGAIFSAIIVTLAYLAGDLPTEIIGHTYSLRYGISIESWGPWLADQAKALGLTLSLEVPVLMLLFGLLHWSPRRYWLWLAVSAVPMSILGTVLLPSLIEPLFNQFEPLAQSHPALVVQLQRVVERTGTSIPPERMFLMKASEKSNGLNAYVTGLGPSKRIVVWDTTADRMPTDEILFTFGHESGHYVLNHIPKGLALGSVGIFVLFWMTARSSDWLVRRYGRSLHLDSIASLPGLAVILLVINVLMIATEPIQNTASRYAEHQADVYGQEAIHGIVPDPQETAVAAFNQLGEAYLDDPNPNAFIEFWSYDHPSLKNRAAFAAQYDPWAPGETPQFFTK